MKRQVKGKILSRDYGQRKALIKSVSRALVLSGKIKTTEAKAKAIAPFVEKMITKAKANDVAAKRYLARFFEASVAKKMTDEIAPKFKERKGGYTRIIKLGARKSDGAKMAIIEFVN